MLQTSLLLMKSLNKTEKQDFHFLICNMFFVSKGNLSDVFFVSKGNLSDVYYARKTSPLILMQLQITNICSVSIGILYHLNSELIV